MFRRIWQRIDEFFKNLFTKILENPFEEYEQLKIQRFHIHESYCEMDKRTSAAKELKRELERIDIRIAELEDVLYG